MDPASRVGLISYFSVLMIDHNVMRFHVSVHDAFAVAEIQRLEKLEYVETDVEVVEFGVEASEIDVVDVLEDERRGLALHEHDMSALNHIRYTGGIGILFTCESRTTSSNATTLGPPARFCRILISRLIFFFLTGLRTLITHFW
jgi:hypothetical protein